MKLSKWAKNHGIAYQTAWRMFKNGQVAGAFQLPTGTIIVKPEAPPTAPTDVAIYARVSSERQDTDLSISAQLRALTDSRCVSFLLGAPQSSGRLLFPG